MHVVQPRVFLLAETTVNRPTLYEFLSAIGAHDWATDAPSEGEELVEVGGRLCYKAFGTDLNANLTRVRGGNHDYILNILKQKHGSVLEHSSVTFALLNVSRIFTHEEVRHRAGVAISQESMRFVRIDEMPVCPPVMVQPLIELAKYVSPGGSEEDDKIWASSVADMFWSKFVSVTREAENAVREVTRFLDKEGVPFHLKKRITTELRRIAPHGIATNIMVTANHRAWRHIIEARTALGADREMRLVTYEIGRQLQDTFPNLYQDMTEVVDEEAVGWAFEHSKV